MRVFKWIGGVVLGLLVGVAVNRAIASRNASGTMSAINGPYISGTTISSSVINARFSDIETELTDSASRSGKGGFTAPVRAAAGLVSAPAFSFTNDPDTGMWNGGANDLRLAAGGADVLTLTTAGASVTGTLAVSGATTFTGVAKAPDGTKTAPGFTFSGDIDTGLYRIGANNPAMSAGDTKVQDWTTTGTTVTGTLGVTGASSLTGNVDIGTAAQGTGASVKTLTFNVGGFAAPGNSFTASNGDKLILYSNAVDTMDARIGIGASADLWYKASNAGGTAFHRFYTGATSTERMRVSDSGVTIGATGTAISASYRGTTSWTPGLLSTNTCATTSITVTGATAGTECMTGSPSSFNNLTYLTCYVTANTCNLKICNSDTGNSTPASGTYSCRVFNP